MSRKRIEVKPLADFESELEYEFKNKDFLRQALTHASAISEKHPMAYHQDYSTLAFLGDSALKYGVARYLIQNGQEYIISDAAELHKGTQTVVPNTVLAEIAQEKLCLEEYMIRGNTCAEISKNMYASCFEAILGAIALDCGVDHQEVIFRLIERLCSDRYETLLKPVDPYEVRFTSACGGDDDDETTDTTVPFVNYMQWQEEMYRPRCEVIVQLPKKTRLQNLGFGILWFFAILGILFIIWHFLLFIEPH